MAKITNVVAGFSPRSTGLKQTRAKARDYIMSALALLLALLAQDRCFPLPAPGRDSPYTLVVLARDGTPLRAFPGSDHVWRHPVSLNEVSPLYVDALITYEDKSFRWHPGVNPFALVRAGSQWLRNGHIVSGGSTITMQVARIVDPRSRTIGGKLIRSRERSSSSGIIQRTRSSRCTSTMRLWAACWKEWKPRAALTSANRRTD